jgi:hypothetical protein
MNWDKMPVRVRFTHPEGRRIEQSTRKSFPLRIFDKCSIVTVKGKAAPAEVTHAVQDSNRGPRIPHRCYNAGLRLRGR